VEDLPFHPSPITTIQFSTDEVFKALISLHPKKAAGVDDIIPEILQHSVSALVHLLHRLFSLSVSNHEIPAEWKLHSVVPVYKSDDKTLVVPYYCVSLISKVLEHLNYNQVFKHISISIFPHQFDFQESKPTLQQNVLSCTTLFPVLMKWMLFILIFARCPSQ